VLTLLAVPSTNCQQFLVRRIKFAQKPTRNQRKAGAVKRCADRAACAPRLEVHGAVKRRLRIGLSRIGLDQENARVSHCCRTGRRTSFFQSFDSSERE